MYTGDPSRLLVIQTAFLGDLILTSPLIRALKERFPRASLEILARKETSPVLEDNPFVDAVIPYDKRGRDAGIAGMVRMAGRLRGRSYELCVSPHRSLRSALIAAAAGIPRRIGVADSPGRWLYHDLVPKDRALHELERHLELMRAVGVDPQSCPRAMVVEVGAEEARTAEGMLRSSGLDPTRPIVGIQPGSVWPTKRWPPERFAAVAFEVRRRGLQVVVVGGPGDREAGEIVLDPSAAFEGEGGRDGEGRPCPGEGTGEMPGAANLAGRTTLKDLVALIDRFTAFITNDSGPMHIAVARGVPVVAIFGPTTPAQGFAPYTDHAVVVEENLPCRPCGRHGHRACPEKHFLCMRLIRPEAVMKAFDEVLDI